MNTLYIDDNHLTTMTLRAGLTNLVTFSFSGNPISTLVLPDLLAVNSFAGVVSYLRSSGVSVYTYPLNVSLSSPQRIPPGVFGFSLAGPSAVYTIFSSTNLPIWNERGTLTNIRGEAVFSDVGSTNTPQKFYRALTRFPH